MHASVYVEGIGFWASRLPGWDAARAVLRGEAEPPARPAVRPAPVLLPPTERRRAPDTVALALEVAQRACESAGREPRELPSVFASTHGDLVVSDYMCDTLAKSPALTSPTRFHNSVHNAAAGYWTIATGCARSYTALSAYTHTFGKGLLEATVQAVSDGTPVLYVAYDIEARGPLGTMAPSRGLLGAALVLSAERSARSGMRLELTARQQAPAAASAPRPHNAALVAGNAMAGCLSLFEALADGQERRVAQTLGPALVLEIHAQPVGQARD